MRYDQVHLAAVYHVQLGNRQQKTKESMQEDEADIALSTRLAHPDIPHATLEKLSIAFVDAIESLISS